MNANATAPDSTNVDAPSLDVPAAAGEGVAMSPTAAAAEGVAAAAEGVGMSPIAAASVNPSAQPPAAAGVGSGHGCGRGGERRGGGRTAGRGGRAGGRGGRQRGSKNYNKTKFIEVVDEIRPYGAEMWNNVSTRYKEVTGEESVRDGKDLKDYWVKKCCNNFKKPTGAHGGPEDVIAQCCAIEREIQAANAAGILGASSAEENYDDDELSSGVESMREERNRIRSILTNSTINVDVQDSWEGGDEFEDAVDVEDDIEINNNNEQANSIVAPTPDMAPIQVRRPSSRGIGGSGSRSTTPVVNSNSGGNKSKNSNNRDRTSVAKSIATLTTTISERLSGGGGGNEFQAMQLQMFQQSQMQMQMQLSELQKMNSTSLKYLKKIAKNSNKKKRKKGNDGGASSFSSSDESD